MKILNEKVSELNCPFCKSTSFKYKQKDRWMFLCHSCQRNVSWLSVENKVPKKQAQLVNVNYSSILNTVKKVSSLEDGHLCKSYVKKRKIPSESYDRLYFTETPNIFAKPAGKELQDGPKLVIPLINKNKKLFGVQLRSLDNQKPKYITLRYNDSDEKIFGMDTINYSEDVTIVEGPIDSLFVKNSIAMAGISTIDDKYKTFNICLDNEPRNKQVIQKLINYVDSGFKVVVWPDRIKQKDVNDMVLAGIDVNKIIKENVYSGLEAKIKINNWKRV